MYAIVQNLQQQLQEQAVRLTQLNEQLQQEIAQRQQIEASLQESEARFQATFEQAAVGMAHVGIEGQFLRVNQKLCEMYGDTREELLKQTFQAITHPDYVDADLNYTRQLLAGELKTYSIEKCYIRKDGTLLWANLTVSLAQAVSRELQYFVVVVTAISDAHNELRLCQQAEATLQFQGKFDRLVASISTRFINLPSPAIPEEINQALQDMGEFMQVDTSYICRISSDRQAFSMTYEWIVPELVPQIQNLQNVPKWIFPWAFAQLQQGKILDIPSIANLPEEAAIERTNWQAFNLKSVICVPLVYQNTVLGWVGFGSYRESKIWSDTDINLLKKFSAILTSVLQRQQTEEALRESKERYNLVIQGSGDGLWDWDITANKTYISPRWKQIIGYEAHELETDSDVFLSRLHPDELEWVQKAIRDHLQQRTPFNLEFRLRHKTGDYIWVQSRGQALWDEAGNPIRMAGSITDISDRKRAEQALQQFNQELEERVKARTQEVEQSQSVLQQREQEVRTLVENSPDIIARFDRELRHLYVNSAITQISELSPDDCLGKTLSELPMFSTCVEQCTNAMHQVFLTGEETQVEIEVPTLKGWRWYQTRFVPEFNSQGRVATVLKISHDITEPKLAEQELKKNRQFIQRIADASPNILYIYDLVEQRNVYVNREIAQILGYTPTEIHAMGSSVLPILMHPDDFAKVPKNLERIYTATDGEILKWEYRMRCANGEWRWIYSHETVFTRTAEGAVQQIIGTAEDISDRKRAEEQIRASLSEKEVLLREIHHRVKNNLNVIHSLLNMQVRTIQDPVTKNLLLDSQKRLQTMALIHEQLYQSQSLAEINFAEYIHRLANNLFAAANLNHDLIKLQIQADSVDLNLETAIPCGLIINELLTNAFKHAFLESHSGVIRIKFYRDQDEILHLIISDNGVGIPPESNLYKKASLGMRLVKILVQQLRATLEISGHQGASFHLSFIQIN